MRRLLWRRSLRRLVCRLTGEHDEFRLSYPPCERWICLRCTTIVEAPYTAEVARVKS